MSFTYVCSSWRTFVQDLSVGTDYVETTSGSHTAWQSRNYICNLARLKKQVYTRASNEMIRLGEDRTCTEVSVEMIDLHFPKGRTDIKVAGFIVRRRMKKTGMFVTERHEIAVRHAEFAD